MMNRPCINCKNYNKINESFCNNCIHAHVIKSDYPTDLYQRIYTRTEVMELMDKATAEAYKGNQCTKFHISNEEILEDFDKLKNK